MSFFIKVFALIFGVMAAASLFTVPYLNQISQVQRKSEVKINEQIIIAEVVHKAGEKEKGLSGRAEIGINEGMLFLYDEPSTPGFWMKGMLFPIDIVWINGTEIVGVTENIEPQAGVETSGLKIYYPPEPVNKILEIKAGRVKILRAEAGDEVKIRPLIGANN